MKATFLWYISSTERVSFRIKDFWRGLHRRQHPQLLTVALSSFSVFQCVILSRLCSGDWSSHERIFNTFASQGSFVLRLSCTSVRVAAPSVTGDSVLTGSDLTVMLLLQLGDFSTRKWFCIFWSPWLEIRLFKRMDHLDGMAPLYLLNIK